jgi:hypothetical protein
LAVVSGTEREEWPRVVAEIAARDSAIADLRPCYCDSAAFWAGDTEPCFICGHEREFHGDDPATCAVLVKRHLSETEADRRALLALLGETRKALHTIHSLADGNLDAALLPNYRAEIFLTALRAAGELAALDPEPVR